VSFGAAWFLLHAFLPYVLFPRVDVVNERHAYVANAGLFLVAGAAWQEWLAPRAPAFRRMAGALATTVLVLLTVHRNLQYRSEVSLWESTVRAAPQNPRAFNNLGVAYEKAERPAAARSAYQRALDLEPRYAAAKKNLSRVSDAR
jgi:protein O-mannosyl-transferase